MNESHFSSRIQCWCTVIAIRKKSQSSTDKLLVLWQHPVASSLFLFQFAEWAVVEGWNMLRYFSPIVTVVEACSVCAASLLQSCPVGPSWETRVVRRGHLTPGPRGRVDLQQQVQSRKATSGKPLTLKEMSLQCKKLQGLLHLPIVMLF